MKAIACSSTLPIGLHHELRDKRALTTDGRSGFMHLACGLSVGLTGLAAGYAIGVVGDMVRLVDSHKQPFTDERS